jgi:MFS family permease
MLALIGMIFGTLILALAFSPTKTLAVVILVPMGAASISFIATNNSILQLRSEPSMRGRVMSLNAIAFLGSTPIGAPLLGWISDMTNPRVSLMVGGAATLAASVPLVLYATKGDRVRRGIVTVDEEVVAEEGGEMVVLPLPQPVNLSGQRRLG